MDNISRATTTVSKRQQSCCNSDQIHGSHKCSAFAGERVFMPLHVAADICPESMVRLIVTELHERQTRCVRITEYWPVRPLNGQELSPATIVVVLQTDQASEVATHFHKNDKFQAYSYDLKGLEFQEYRSIKDPELPVSWNMEAVWRREEHRERSRRARLKYQFRMGPTTRGDIWLTARKSTLSMTLIQDNGSLRCTCRRATKKESLIGLRARWPT